MTFIAAQSIPALARVMNILRPVVDAVSDSEAKMA